MIINKEVNITLGYFASTLLRDTFMTASYVYHTSNLVWVVPPGEQSTPLEKLLKPFDGPVWIIFSLVILCAFAFVRSLRSKRYLQAFVFGENVQDPYLNIVNVSLGGSMHKLPVRNFARSLLGMFFVYCFIMQNAYKGGLFKFMQMTVRDREIATTDELIDKGFSFYMFPASKAYLDGMPKINEKTVFVDEKRFAQLLNESTNPESKGALLSSEEHLTYRNILASPNRFYVHAKEIIFTNNLVIFLTKDSFLENQINQCITYLVNGGFIQNWASKFIDKNFLNRKHAVDLKPLTMLQLEGCFELLVTGLFVSGVVFMFEIVKWKFEKHRKFRQK